MLILLTVYDCAWTVVAVSEFRAPEFEIGVKPSDWSENPVLYGGTVSFLCVARLLATVWLVARLFALIHEMLFSFF